MLVAAHNGTSADLWPWMWPLSSRGWVLRQMWVNFPR